MMRGIDISSWQEGMDVSAVIERNELGFVIAKATEGLAFVDSTCDRFVQAARNAGACWGFYHFARNNDPLYVSGNGETAREECPVLSYV